ncbi:MAG: CPBP family intramembrane metalloprotease [Candidatus Sphingomonas colombiensis]|nr:CPBP family intramembrane glutamic endopeptidase [Sphingomonas sp.]WEK42715.1 MAG: CPBP family intramembrane metalloprotease [Sphingomonas sp.]
MIAALLLAALLAMSWYVRRRLALNFGHGRSGAYLAVALRQIGGFAAPALIALTLAGEWRALRRMPESFARLAETYGIAGWVVPGDGWTLLIGAVGGSALGAGIAFIQWRRRGSRGPMFGELGWLLPRDRADLGWGLLLSLVAGVAEEVFFRLAVPLLVALATGSALAGFILSALMFAAAHRYQGMAGVIATGAMGIVFTALYLTTGALWLAIAAHIVVDLNSLVIRPAITGAWRA